MTEHITTTMGRLQGLIERRLKRLEREIGNTINKDVIEDAADAIRLRAPKAFGDLRDSVHPHGYSGTEGNLLGKVVVDAPHAGAVEIGSAPHMPDLDRLIEWVKLRGMQGLRNLRSANRHGPTTRDQATKVKNMLRAEVQRGSQGQYSPIDAPRTVAMAIARGIQLHGTKPYFFVRDSLPVISMRLSHHVRRAVKRV